MRFTTLMIAALLMAAPAFAQSQASTVPAPATSPVAAEATVVAKPAGKRLPGDENGDGMISQDEFTNAQLKRFKAMDANADGSVSTDEMKSYNAKMAESRRARAEKAEASKVSAPKEGSFLSKLFGR